MLQASGLKVHRVVETADFPSNCYGIARLFSSRKARFSRTGSQLISAETPMRFEMRYLILRDGISDEIG